MQQVVKIDATITKAFEINIKEVQAMVKKYQTLTLVPDDKESYQLCQTALTSCVRTRTGINKRRLELNKADQDRIKKRNAAAKQLEAIVAPAEDHLSGLINTEKARLQAIEDEKRDAEKRMIDDRIKQLGQYRVILPYQEIALMTDEEFDTALFDAKEEWKAEQERQAKAEAARKAEEERLEKQRKEQEAEAARLAKIREEQEAEQAAREAELKKQADELAAKEKAIQDEKDRIAKEEADKKAAEEAKIQAEKAVKERAEREAKEAAEKEKREKEEAARQEALKPDKEKLLKFADDINEWGGGYTAEKFLMKSEDAQLLFNYVLQKIQDLEDDFRERIEKL